NDGSGNMRPPTPPMPDSGASVTVDGDPGGAMCLPHQVFADFNGDGRTDFVTTSHDWWGTGLDVYLARADGTYQHSSHVVANAGDGPWVQAGDLNNDGIPDLVFGPYAYGGLNVFLGNGDGTFRPAPTSFYEPGGYGVDGGT